MHVLRGSCIASRSSDAMILLQRWNLAATPVIAEPFLHDHCRNIRTPLEAFGISKNSSISVKSRIPFKSASRLEWVETDTVLLELSRSSDLSVFPKSRLIRSMQHTVGLYGYDEDAIHVVDMHTTGEASAR